MKKYDEYKQIINSELNRVFEGWGAHIPETLRNAMEYSLSAGGKRLRPVLLLAACESVNGSIDDALPFACALEMIHTYSLIHDDLPAMDNDDLRRGKPTNHKVFGDAVAILAGDGLLNAAAELMCHAAVKMGDQRGIRAADAVMKRAGITGMIAGQVMDVTQEGTELSEDKITYIHEHKTADLLTAPMEAGMLLGCAPESIIEAGRTYGYHLGMAFQLIDDILDVTGDAAILGKNTGTDPIHGKLTQVAYAGVEKTREAAHTHIDIAVKAASSFDTESCFFEKLALESLNRVF